MDISRRPFPGPDAQERVEPVMAGELDLNTAPPLREVLRRFPAWNGMPRLVPGRPAATPVPRLVPAPPDGR
ncbi:hypothetical protein ACFVYF_13385 [Streptomyces sp. NPDC058274]|jgi:hypothetical protein|uniref:hypothetical protein n=1 Tax=Streptomyces sp. NPDC058274 TaxID=3346416 RepID=UPI0036ECB97C